MICPNCNNEIPDGNNFCTRCGAKLSDYEVQDAEVQDAEVHTEDTDEDQAPDMTNEAAAAEQVLGGARTIAEEAPVASELGYGVGTTETIEGVATPMGAAAPVGATVAKAGVSLPVLFGIIGGGAFLVIAIVALSIVVMTSGKKSYNLRDYTRATYEGTDGYGVADISIYEEGLAKAMLKDKGVDVDRIEEEGLDALDEIKGINAKDVMNIYNAIASISVNADKLDKLSNGDAINVTYSYNEDTVKDAKVEFVAEPVELIVSGLDEIEEIDPFENLQIDFEGTSPNVYVTLNGTGTSDAEQAIYFEPSQRDELKLGTEITVSVEGYDEESFLANYGVRFTQTEKSFTVEGVDSYLLDNEELDDKALSIMKESVESYITEYFADSSRRSAIKAQDISYEGYYFLTNKYTNVWGGYNKVYMIYSATVSSKEKPKQFKPKKVYFPVEYEDVLLKSDGEYEINTAYRRILGSTDLKFGFWQTVSGYTSMSDMHEELIDADAANYDGVAYGSVE